MNKDQLIIKITMILFAFSFLVACGGSAPPPVPATINGFGWGWTICDASDPLAPEFRDAGRGDYLSPGAAGSLKALAQTGAGWISLSFAPHMENRKSTEILYGDADPAMVTDDEIRRAVALSRDNNLKVLVKPAIYIKDGSWRAEINLEGEDLDQTRALWNTWWDNYGKLVLHYAALAQELGCEAFCVGSEMNSTESFAKKWEELITRVRGVYHGLLTYAVNHDHMDSIKWWDKIDFIGVSAYYSLPESKTVEDLKRSWAPAIAKLSALAAETGKKIVFIEIGIRSAAGLAATPWDYLSREKPYDAAEQARYYQAAFEAMHGQEWFLGFLWWDWPVVLYPEEYGKQDTGFSVYGKPAEDIVKKYFSAGR